MSNKNRDIDRLLRGNVERQLADCDWEGLSRRIDGLIMNAVARPTSRYPYGRWVAMAAGVALVGGILVLAMIRTTGPGFVGPAEGMAKVTMLETVHPTGTAQVSFARVERSVRCEVTIHASNTPRRESQAPASWCIIAKHEGSVETRRGSPDSSDVLCLF